jgi:hypothetical protein
VATELTRLAELVTAARWSEAGLDADDGAEVERLADTILTALRLREPATV